MAVVVVVPVAVQGKVVVARAMAFQEAIGQAPLASLPVVAVETRRNRKESNR